MKQLRETSSVPQVERAMVHQSASRHGIAWMSFIRPQQLKTLKAEYKLFKTFAFYIQNN